MSLPIASVSTLTSEHFTPFRLLPTEIRIQIWHLTLTPRIVEVFASTYQTGFYTQAALPSTLQVNHESRHTLLPHCPLTIGSSLEPSRIRFNADLDTLYFDQHLSEDKLYHLLVVLKATELQSLKYVAFDDRLVEDDPSDMVNFMHEEIRLVLSVMTRLQELLLVRYLEETDDDGVPRRIWPGERRAQIGFSAGRRGKNMRIRDKADDSELKGVERNWKDYWSREIGKSGRRSEFRLFMDEEQDECME